MPTATETRAAARAAGAGDYEDLWQAWDEFFTAVSRARGPTARERSDGPTVPQYRLLSAVAESPAVRSGELAERMGVSAPTTTRMLSALERAGIVRRDPIHGDGRGVAIALTAKGRRLLDRKRP